MPIDLKRAAKEDISSLIDVEKSIGVTPLYSALLTYEEWEEELKNGIVYFIVYENTIVGSISYQKKENDHAYISGLVVDPLFQGRGIARAALAKLLEMLEDFKRIDLVTHPNNKVALSLYNSFGFTLESRKENYFGDGEPRVVLVLTKK